MFSHSPPCHPIPTNKNPTQEELPEDVQHRSSDDLDEAKWSSNQPRKANNTYGRVWNLSSRLRYVQRVKGQYSLGLFLMFKYLDLLGLVKVSHHWRVAKVVGFLWLHFFNVRSPEEPPSWLKIHVVPKTVGFTLRPRHNFLKIDGTGFRIPNVWGGDRQDGQSHTHSVAHSDTMARLLGGPFWQVYQNQEQIILSTGEDGRYRMNWFIFFVWICFTTCNGSIESSVFLNTLDW